MELKSEKIIAEVGEFLRVPIPKDDLEDHIIGLEALRFELATQLVDSMMLLYQKRKQMLWPKDAEKGMTELDRTTRLNGDVAILERDYKFLQRLEELIDSRLKLAIFLLGS